MSDGFEAGKLLVGGVTLGFSSCVIIDLAAVAQRETGAVFPVVWATLLFIAGAILFGIGVSGIVGHIKSRSRARARPLLSPGRWKVKERNVRGRYSIPYGILEVASAPELLRHPGMQVIPLEEQYQLVLVNGQDAVVAIEAPKALADRAYRSCELVVTEQGEIRTGEP